MSGRECSVCGEESDKTYRCSNCGKLFDGDSHAGNGRMRTGGQ